MVLTTLFDPSMAPGPDGFSGAFYRSLKQPFAPVMLELIRTATTDNTLPRKGIKGMTRCIPKEAGIPASDCLRPITLLKCKMKSLIGVFKICLEDLE